MRFDDGGSDPVSLGDGECIRETEKAVLVCFVEKLEEIWIPKSVLHDDSGVFELDQDGDVVVQQWWAEANGYA